jgi:carbamoyl-phosphate synthase large subunit
MGIDTNFPLAYAKAQMAAGGTLPTSGTIYVSVRNADKNAVIPAARKLAGLGFKLLATGGTHKVLSDAGIPAERVHKVHEARPNAIDLLMSGDIQLLINTPLGKLTQQDDYAIRRAALQHRIPYTTTLSAASAACDAIIALRNRAHTVRSLQEWYEIARRGEG